MVRIPFFFFLIKRNDKSSILHLSRNRSIKKQSGHSGKEAAAMYQTTSTIKNSSMLFLSQKHKKNPCGLTFVSYFSPFGRICKKAGVNIYMKR